VRTGTGGVREALWVSAALLRANRPQVGWMLPPPPAPPPAPRPVPQVPAPLPVPVPPPPEPPAPEPVPAPVPAPVLVLEPVPAPVPPVEESGPTELALGVLVGIDAAWGVGLKGRVGAEAWSVEVRAEGQHLRAPARATRVGLDASRTVLGGQLTPLWGRVLAAGPVLRAQLRPEVPAGPPSPRLGLGAGTRLHLETKDLRVSLRLDVVGEPVRESRLLVAEDGTPFEVRAPALYVVTGVDLGLGSLRGLR
jgi:hypothetical protein